ncbi:MAG: hypothetical protein AAF512_14620, partial [Pseudomonadota bacterium]
MDKSFPQAFLEQANIITQTLETGMHEAATGRWLVVCILACIWIVFVIRVRREILGRLQAVPRPQSASFSSLALWHALKLLNYNLGGILLAGLLLIFLSNIQVALLTTALLLSLIGIWLFFKAMINLAWLMLMIPETPPSYHSPGLYQQLRGALLCVGVLAGFTLFIHIMNFPAEIRNINDVIFMLSLLLLIYPLWQIQRLATASLTKNHRGHWLWALRSLNVLILGFILLTSLMG